MATEPDAPAETPAIGTRIDEPVLQSFDDAFASAARDEPPAPDPAPAPTPDPAPAQPAAGGTTKALESEIELPDPAAPPAPTPPPDEGLKDGRMATDEALTRLADMMAQRTAQPQQPQQPQQRQPQPPPSLFSPDEQSVVNQFYTDYPDVARAVAIERSAEYKALTSHIFGQIGAYLAPHLALLGQLADRTVYSDIATKVPDYNDLRDKLLDWVGTQPAYLQAAYNSVIQQGTVEEITDLFDRYRQASGQQAPSAQNAPAQGTRAAPPAAKAPELSPAAKQAAERLAPVTSKRSAPTSQTPVDFDAAFAEFAKAG
jgi:hypothetical protein